MLEPYEWKRSRTVLRRERASNRPDLADRDRLTEGYNYVLDNARQSEDLVDYQRCMQMFVESVSRKKCIPLGTLQMFIVQLIKSMEPLALHQVSDVTMTGIMSLRTQMLLRLSPEDIRADLEEFLHQVCAFEGNQSKQNYTGRAQELRAYLDEHYRKKFTLDELASIFYLNKEYMSKLFRKEYGIRIGEYVDFLKIEDAKRLLLLGNMTVSEITELLNFYDESHFNKKFKKAVGVNPKDFRK